MQTIVESPNVKNLPEIGYYTSGEERKKKFCESESHIKNLGPFADIKAGAHKLTNDVFTYFPKGFSGSKNSDFYEFLSLGMVPNIIGSLMLIALYGATGKFNSADASAANKVRNCMGAGVALYAIGKSVSEKIINSMLHLTTGVNLNMKYVNKVNEVPENGHDKGLVRIQYPGVFDSVDFYRKDLLEKNGELEHKNVYHYYDKIAKKAGFKENLNAPNQTMGPKIRELKARTTALSNIVKYVAAATGVALGAQKSFEKLSYTGVIKKTIDTKSLKAGFSAAKANFVNFFEVIKGAGKELWKGTDKNIFTKHGGKALVIASALTTTLAWLIPTIKFKTNPNTMKSKINHNKEYEVC